MSMRRGEIDRDYAGSLAVERVLERISSDIAEWQRYGTGRRSRRGTSRRRFVFLRRSVC